MADIKKLNDYAGDQFFPVTHERAVRDDDGVTLETKLQTLSSNLSQAIIDDQAYSDSAVSALETKVDNGFDAIDYEISNMETDYNAKVDALIAGAKLSLSFSPEVIYKNTATTVSISSVQSGGITPLSITIYPTADWTGTPIATVSNESSASGSLSVNTSSNTVPVSSKSVWRNILFKDSSLIQARNPIKYGFAGVWSDVATLYPATTSATGKIFTSTSASDGVKFFIIVPEDIENPVEFTMGNIPFVMTSSTQTVSGVTYTVFESGASYNSGVTVSVLAS